MPLFKRTWIVEEATFPTHKQYTSYEIRKLFGITVSKELLYENGLTSSAVSPDEMLFTRCTFLSPDGAMQAINLRKRALLVSCTPKAVKRIIKEVE